MKRRSVAHVTRKMRRLFKRAEHPLTFKSNGGWCDCRKCRLHLSYDLQKAHVAPWSWEHFFRPTPQERQARRFRV